MTFDPRLAKALSHPLRVEILELLNEREASPTELARLLSVALNLVSYHAKVLVDCGAIELVRREPRRGTYEHFYRAVPRSSIGHQAWRQVPPSLVGEVSAASIQSFVDKAVAALEAGTLDGRDGTVLNSMGMTVDELGWIQAADVLDAALTQLEAIHEQSRQRLKVTGKEAIPVVIGLAAFEVGIKPAGPRS